MFYHIADHHFNWAEPRKNVMIPLNKRRNDILKIFLQQTQILLLSLIYISF